MSLQLHVDFSGDDWVGFQRASDSPNRWGAVAVNTADLQRYVSSGGGSATTGSHARYSDARAKYGKGYVRWTTSTGGAAAIRLGWDGASAFNTVAETTPNGTYTIVLWAKISGAASANTFRLNAGRDAGTGVASGTSQTISETAWTKFKTTFVYTATAGNDQIWMELQRTAGTDNLTIDVTGAMFYAGSGDQWLNCGTASLLEDVTPYWGGGKWGLGFVKPYQYVAPVGKAELKLNNHDKRFSPEYASGPLYGNLLPNLLVQIADPDYGIWWTGWTDSWAPEPNLNGEKKAKLSATDARRLMGRKLPNLPLFTDSMWINIVNSILDEFSTPNSGGTAIDRDGTNVTGDAWLTTDGEVVLGESYADNVPYDHDAVKVLGDLMGAQQGKLWCDREGVFQTRVNGGANPPSAYVDLSNLHMDGDYGVTEIINKCEVIGRKRKTQSSGGPFTIWELDETFEIAGSGTEEFRIHFTHSNESKTMIGAGGTFAITETNSGVAGDITAALSDVGGQSAIITYTNNNAAARTVLTTTVTATTRVTQLREFSKETEDATSIEANGLLAERLDFSFVQSRSFAKKLANFRVNRFKDPTYAMTAITLDGNEYTADLFDCWVGAAVRVADSQLDHDEYYAVIGEQHTVRDGLTNHTAKLYLEPIYAATVDGS